MKYFLLILLLLASCVHEKVKPVKLLIGTSSRTGEVCVQLVYEDDSIQNFCPTDKD